MMPYLVTKFEEQEPNTKLLIPDSDIYLRSAVAGSSSSSTRVSIYRSSTIVFILPDMLNM
jgi:hypothetical protein